MSSLACDNCKKEFKTVSNLDKHKNKKKSCKKKENKRNNTKVENINTKVEDIDTKVEDIKEDIINLSTDDNIKKTLSHIFEGCINILRWDEGLTGREALRVLTYTLVLKLLEPQFNNDSIDIDNCEYYDFTIVTDSTIGCYNCIDSTTVGKKCTKCRLLDMVRLSKFKEEKEENTIDYMMHVWNIILSKHPATRIIFREGGSFEIEKKSTFHLLINKLETLDMKTINYNNLGEEYEKVIQNIMSKSRVLGQYFTPSCVKLLMVKTINPVLSEDGKMETCCDPTMGFGGLLIAYINEIKKQAVEKKKDFDWEQCRSNIYGKEREPFTYQSAVSNMLISTGCLFDQLECGDSIREPIQRKFDNILANPPFGIKLRDYDNMGINVTKSYIPIKTSSAVFMFLQAIVHMLNINGKCAIVLPVGKELTCKSLQFKLIREYLMKTCDLKEIILLPNGVFTYTDIGTCIFHFVKKVEGSTVLDIKISKKQREYKFINEHQTKSVKFYNYNTETETKTLIIDVPLDRISNNSYVLNYSEYLEDEKEITYGNTVTMKTLGEIFGEKTRNYITLRDDVKYNVIGLSAKGVCKLTKTVYGHELKVKKQHNCKENQFALGAITNGAHGIVQQELNNGIISPEFWLFNINSNITNQKYLCLIFKDHIYPKIQKLSRGLGIPRITYDNFKSIKIPLPPLVVQNILVAKLDRIYESINTSNKSIETYRDANKRQIERQAMNIDNKLITLGEICKFRCGDCLDRKSLLQNGRYNVIGGGKIVGKCNIKNTDSNTIVISRVGYFNITFMKEEYYLTDNGFVLNTIDESNNIKYLYYVLLYKKIQISNLYSGTAQKIITKPRLYNIKIRLPTLEVQNQIVAACDRRNEMIANLEAFIEELKLEAKETLREALMNAPVETEDVFNKEGEAVLEAEEEAVLEAEE